MRSPMYSKDVAGSKTFWVIEFLPEDESALNIRFVPITLPKNNDFFVQEEIGVVEEEEEEEEVVEEDEGPFEESLEDLYSSVRESCEQSADGYKQLKLQSEAMREQIQHLEEIIRNFDDLLNQFKNDRDDPSK